MFACKTLFLYRSSASSKHHSSPATKRRSIKIIIILYSIVIITDRRPNGICQFLVSCIYTYRLGYVGKLVVIEILLYGQKRYGEAPPLDVCVIAGAVSLNRYLFSCLPTLSILVGEIEITETKPKSLLVTRCIHNIFIIIWISAHLVKRSFFTQVTTHWRPNSGSVVYRHST